MPEAKGILQERRVPYSGRVITTTIDRVRMPNGREVELEIVRHRGSVVLIPIPDPSHVILVRQYRYAVDRWLWELPAGSLEEGEQPEEAARRECHEEIDLIPGTIERVGLFYPTPGFCDETMMFFRLTGLTKPSVAAAQDEDEDIAPRAFSLEEARRMLASGDIIDMKTAVGLTLLIDRSIPPAPA